jgi:hypothetical protein
VATVTLVIYAVESDWASAQVAASDPPADVDDLVAIYDLR